MRKAPAARANWKRWGRKKENEKHPKRAFLVRTSSSGDLSLHPPACLLSRPLRAFLPALFLRRPDFSYMFQGSRLGRMRNMPQKRARSLTKNGGIPFFLSRSRPGQLRVLSRILFPLSVLFCRYQYFTLPDKRLSLFEIIAERNIVKTRSCNNAFLWSLLWPKGAVKREKPTISSSLPQSGEYIILNFGSLCI